jgi:hypothetical protein
LLEVRGETVAQALPERGALGEGDGLGLIGQLRVLGLGLVCSRTSRALIRLTEWRKLNGRRDAAR